MSESQKSERRTETAYGDETPEGVAKWEMEQSGANDYEIIETDGDEVTFDLIWERDDRVDQATLPEGVEPAEVTFNRQHPEVLAHANNRPFDPRDGRWYKLDPAGAGIETTGIAAGIEVDCAYADCNGHTTVEIRGDIDRSCPECNSKQMGRSQFSTAGSKSRKRRSGISTKTDELSDDFAEEMRQLTNRGVSTVAAMDYLMCSVGEIPYETWAEARGVEKYSVKRNIKRVAQTLGETVTYKTKGT